MATKAMATKALIGMRVMTVAFGAILVLAIPYIHVIGNLTLLSGPEAGSDVSVVTEDLLPWASGFFFYVGIFARRLVSRDAPWVRIIAVSLFLPSMCAFISVPIYGRSLIMMFLYFPITLLSLSIFSAFVWPRWLSRI